MSCKLYSLGETYLVYSFTCLLVYLFTRLLVYSFTKFLFNNYFLNLCLFVHEERGAFVELLRAFRREAMQRAASRARRGHIRVPPEIFGEALSHVFALRHDAPFFGS